MELSAPLTVERLRHPLKFRLLQVRRVVRLSPYMVCITFTGDDLADFVSASFDDHLKVFLPHPGETAPALPTLGPDGPVYPQGRNKPITRDYTPRRYDAATGELDIEFVLHDAGPATLWAAQAQPGQCIGIGGPRGSFVIPTGYDWHLLVGDESALSAIARRLEELPAGSQAHAVLSVSHEAARLTLQSAAQLHLTWVTADSPHRQADSMLAALQQWATPAGQGYAWVAGELSMVRAVRSLLLTERGLDKARVRAASYWKQGEIASHETLDD